MGGLRNESNGYHPKTGRTGPRCDPGGNAAHALADRDTVEIAVDGDRIVLQKHTPRCVFCSRSEALVEYHNRRVCASCMRELSAMGGGTKVVRRRTED